MLRLDSDFNDKNLVRFIMLHKIRPANSFLIPKLDKMVCLFNLTNLEDLDDVKIYNYYYFFKFFLGSKAFIVNYSMNQGYGKTTHDFNIQITLCKNQLHMPLSFIINDILPIVDKDYVQLKIIESNTYSFNLLIDDMNIFSEKKTNLGLFHLKDILNIKFFLSKSTLPFARLYFNHLKLYF